MLIVHYSTLDFQINQYFSDEIITEGSPIGLFFQITTFLEETLLNDTLAWEETCHR